MKHGHLMALSSADIFHHVMDNVTADVPNSVFPRAAAASSSGEHLPSIQARAALYRSELEAQIREKRELDKRRRELEELEEAKLQRKIEKEREQLRREYQQEVETRTKTQDEARRRQQTIAKRLEEMQIEEARQRDEEAAKRKRVLLESLYQRELTEPKSGHSAYYFRKPWNSQDYVYGRPLQRDWHLSLEKLYTTAPLHLLADVYRKLEEEKLKLREIIRLRIARGDEE